MTNVTRGVFPPITTPFTDSDTIDYDDLERNIQRLEAAGVDGIVSCGSTGERSTLRPEEHRDVIEVTVDAAETPVVAGTGAPSTWEVIELTQHAESVGAAGALVLAPYYTSPSDEDIRRHYEEIADAVDIPIVLYNYPAAIGFNLEPDIVVSLAEHPNVVGIKDSLGDIQQLDELCRRTSDLEFDVMSGWDSLLWPGINLGATGLIGITANVFPEDIVALFEASKAGDRETALPIHRRVAEFESALVMKNPQITVSAALEIQGYSAGNVRKPQYPLGDDQTERLRAAIAEFERSREETDGV